MLPEVLWPEPSLRNREHHCYPKRIFLVNTSRKKTEVLVIGTGIAGMTTALTLADAGLAVTLVTAGDTPEDGNSALAQGGIVYKATDERPGDLVQDVLVAGGRVNHGPSVRFLAEKGPGAVEDILLNRLQVPFDKNALGEWDLIREGGHGRERILHAADRTGKVIQDCLLEAVKAHTGIELLTKRTAVDLLTTHHHSTRKSYSYHLTNQCCGAYIFVEEAKEMETVFADYTVLATGGIGQIYLHTTNTATSIGSGLTMAARAGSKVINTEYVQFHPTSLYHNAPRKFLISEAVRGAGAKLINAKGEGFLHRYDKRQELAPRDIVTRAIQDEMLQSGTPCVYLDAANHVRRDIKKDFPTILKKCQEIGVDMTTEPIPVVPAAHYFCGGILTNTRGQTTLDRLFACGECSCTGVHGANRLASTSLLESLLWAREVGTFIADKYSRRKVLSKKLMDSVPDWVSTKEVENEDPALIAQDWGTIRHTMWNYVGITRTSERLRRAVDDIHNMQGNLRVFYEQTRMSKALIDLFHGSYAAYLVTFAALRNAKSAGCHYRPDS